VATTGRTSAVGIVGPTGWRAGAYKRRASWGRRLRGWLFISSSAVFAVAMVAGCDSGHTAANSAAPAANTAASPTPAITGSSPSPARIGTTAVCVKSGATGTCGPFRYPAITNSDGQNTFVGQNVWSPISGWSQTLYATSPGQWSVTAKMPAGNTSVVSYPNTGQQFYYTNKLTGFSSIYSGFSENMHPNSGTVAWAAYDIWLNNWNNEVMIQHDFSFNGGNGPCDLTPPVIATFGGSGGVPVQTWHLCKFGSELIWQLNGGNAREKSGTVDLLAMLTWLMRHGYLPQGSGLTDISYGFEICSTGGRPETFAVSHFSLSTR